MRRSRRFAARVPGWPRRPPSSGSRRWATCCSHVPHSLPRPRRAPPAVEPADRRAGHGGGRGALGAPRRTRRRGLTIVEATVADDSGPAKAVWFNQPWLAERLREGTRLLLYGKLDRSGFRVEAHEFADDRDGAGIHTTGLVPVHPASERLRPQRIRDWAWQVQPLARHALEPLPAELRARRRLAGAGDALATAHFPGNLAERGASPRPARVRGALPAPGGARGSPAGSPGRPARHRPRPARRAGRALAWVAALRAHRRSAARDRGDRRRPGGRHGRCSGC